MTSVVAKRCHASSMTTTCATILGMLEFGASVLVSSTNVELTVVANLRDLCFEEMPDAGCRTGLDRY
jgi:hypothetical protein